jgi:hypothetical protein
MVMKQKNVRMQGESSYREVGGSTVTRASPACLGFWIHAEIPAGNNLYRSRGEKKMLIIRLPIR